MSWAGGGRHPTPFERLEQGAPPQRRVRRPGRLHELAEGEDLAERRRARARALGAVGGLGGQDEVGLARSGPRSQAGSGTRWSLVPLQPANSASIVSLTSESSKPRVPALLTSTPESGPRSCRARSSR